MLSRFFIIFLNKKPKIFKFNRFIIHLLLSSFNFLSEPFKPFPFSSIADPFCDIFGPDENSSSISFGSGFVISSSALHSKLFCWLLTKTLFCLEFIGDDGFDPLAFCSNSVRLLLGLLCDWPFVSLVGFGVLLFKIY